MMPKYEMLVPQRRSFSIYHLTERELTTLTRFPWTMMLAICVPSGVLLGIGVLECLHGRKEYGIFDGAVAAISVAVGLFNQTKMIWNNEQKIRDRRKDVDAFLNDHKD